MKQKQEILNQTRETVLFYKKNCMAPLSYFLYRISLYHEMCFLYALRNGVGLYICFNSKHLFISVSFHVMYLYILQ